VLGLSGLAACAAPATRDAGVDPLFVDATPRLGEDIVVFGELRWRAQTRELVPMAAERLALPRPCLPILIPLGETTLAQAAMRLDGKRVRVEGVIVEAMARGLVATPACRKVGLRVAVLEAAK
jgi:hypothetical protein